MPAHIIPPEAAASLQSGTARPEAPIERVSVSVYRVPTETPESDGTLEWDATTMVLVRVTAAGQTGLGYTYASESAATLIRGHLTGAVMRSDAMAVQENWARMVQSIRNLGRPGFAQWRFPR